MDIETKFEVNDEVWIMRDNMPIACTIHEVLVRVWDNNPIMPNIVDIGYLCTISEGSNSRESMKESQLFKTKDELLDSLR